MIFKLLINPITSSKKLFDKLNDNTLIGLSIGIPLLTAILPAFFIMKSVLSFVKSILGMSNMFGSILGSSTTNIDSNIGSSIFQFLFGKLLTITLIISLVVFLAVLVYYKIRKIKITPRFIWQAMMVSAIQIVYYILIAGILSFIAVQLYIVVLVGIVNSIICLYSLLLEADASYVNKDMPVEEKIISETKSQVASSLATGVQTTKDNIFKQNLNNSQETSISLSEKIKELSKKQKTVLASILSVAVVAIVLFCIGNSVTSKANVSNKLSQAIKNNDSKEMAKYIVCSDSRLKINQDTLNPYLKYLKDNPSYTSRLLEAINSQQNNASDTGTSSEIINLTTHGKKYIFFNNYVFQLPAYFINVQTDYKNTEVSLNNNKLYSADSDNFQKECGPFLPGSYTLNSSLKTDYAQAKGHVDVLLDPQYTTNNIKEVNLPLEGSKLNLYSSFEDAKILINGKDTGITVKNADSLMPLPTDGSYKVQLQNKFPWGTLSSNESVFGTDSLELNFDKGNKNLLEAVKPTIVEFANSYVNAFKALDVSKFTNVTDNYKKFLTDDINNDKTFNYSYTGSLSTVTVDLSSLQLNYNSYSDEKYSIYCDISFIGDFSSNGQPYFNNKSYQIKLIYDETNKKWLVDNLYSNWFGDSIQNGTDIKLN